MLHAPIRLVWCSSAEALLKFPWIFLKHLRPSCLQHFKELERPFSDACARCITCSSAFAQTSQNRLSRNRRLTERSVTCNGVIGSSQVHFYFTSMSALRDWEEGASQHAQLQLLLLQRSAADKAYAQALVRLPDQDSQKQSKSKVPSLVLQCVAMSLGWLTESSLIPKEPKEIGGVSTSSLLNLQAVVYDREQRGNVPSAKRRKAVAEAKARNDGVDARNARDQQQQDAKERPDLVRTRLEEKAKRYEALASGAAGTDKDEPLVDFDRKRAQGLLPPAKQELENSAPVQQDTNAGSTVWAGTWPRSKNQEPPMPTAKQTSGPLWASPKKPVPVQTEFRTHFGHWQHGKCLRFQPSRFVGPWERANDMRPITADYGLLSRSGSAVATAIHGAGWQQQGLKSSDSTFSSRRPSKGSLFSDRRSEEDDVLDPAAMYCTSSEHYGKGSLPSWVNDKKCAKPMSPEASFASSMIKCGIPFDASIRFNKAGDLSDEFPPPPCLHKPEILPRVPMQPFEKPRSTAEDLDLRERLTAETDLARDTLGNKKRAAREAVRGRLAALRAAREASEASGTEATGI
eukprot:s471_g18.t1